MDYYISTERLSVGYNGVPLIENINIGVHRGEILTLIGPNGSGKSTILKSIIRELRLVAGTVVLDGESMKEIPEKELSKKLAIVMTERLRGDLLTCWDVVATGRYPYTGRLGLLSREDREKVDEAIRLVHAEDFADSNYQEISDGQRQRLLLARAVCQEPEVVVLDEPTSFLDIRHKLELLDILKKMVRTKNMAVVMSLHELDLAQKISDRVVTVADHRIDRYGKPEEIFRDDYIRSLYGMDKGSYNALFGSLEMEPAGGEPKVFVIGGGGAGIPLYRALQRNGISFAAGILQENDLDFPVAKALAAELVSVPAFRFPDEEAVKRARELLLSCGTVISCVREFAEGNRANEELKAFAEARGLLRDPEELFTNPEGETS